MGEETSTDAVAQTRGGLIHRRAKTSRVGAGSPVLRPLRHPLALVDRVPQGP